jgi:hypothetical protein
VLAALVLACVCPALARADKLVFRNDCTAPVVLQAVTLHRGVVQRERPYLLNPRDSTPEIAMRGDRILTIYDARCPNRVLYQGALASEPGNQRYSILPDQPAPRVKLQRRPMTP